METIVRGTFVGEKRPRDVVVRDGRIAAVRAAGHSGPGLGSRETVIGPTLFDVQVNGVGGVTLQTTQLVPADVRTVTDTLAASGVSHWMPTVVTGPHRQMAHACRTIVEALEDKTVARAVPGIHVEGPYISPLDGPRGAHPKRHVRPPNLREFDRLNHAADGRIVYVTLAPEVRGAIRFIKALVRRGVTVALGHHNGSGDDIARAVDAGARLCTHLGNGLMSFIHRHHNPLWPQLGDDRLAAALIADLEHLPPHLLRTFIRAKGADNVVLTSDCVFLAGLKPGRYEFAGQEVELLRSGRICLVGTDLLAGSSLMLVQGVVNAARVTDLTLEQAFACATTIPAKLFGLRRRFALPKKGARANFLAFDTVHDRRTKRPNARIQCVYVNGERKA